MLLYYGEFYRQVYDLDPGDRPEAKLIENDEEIDRWWERFVREKEREWARLHNKTSKDWKAAEDGKWIASVAGSRDSDLGHNTSEDVGKSQPRPQEPRVTRERSQPTRGPSSTGRRRNRTP
jgi:hypothetical protein